MTRYSPAEMEIRLAAVKPIVEAAYAIRGIVLGEEKIAVYAEHWEAAFGRVATAQLRDLYRVGLEKQCKTAEEFLMRWEMKVESEAAAEAHRKFLAKRAAEESKAQPIPPHILKKWSGQGVAKAN